MTATPSASDVGPRERPLIAHVVYRFAVGGLENGVVNLINRLPADRYDHAVIALTDVSDFRRRITRDGVSFHALHKPPGHGFAIYRDLYRLFGSLRPSIVHTRNIAASEAQLPAALAGVPVRIHGEHGWEVSDVGGGKSTHRLQRRLLRPLIHRQVALSGEIRRYLEDRVGVAPSDIAQICNGVDVARFGPRPRVEGDAVDAHRGPVGRRFPGTDLFVVGTVGRLSPVKHQRLLVDAFVRTHAMLLTLAPSDAARLRLVVAGDGPDREPLEAMVRASGLADRIWMTGSRDDVPELMAGLDLFVLPSLAEGISNTILEAMACELPVVATRVGGNAELIEDGVTGTLVASDDVHAMASALRGYATSPIRARGHGRAGRERVVERFSIETMVASYAELYDSLLAACRKPTRPIVTDASSASSASSSSPSSSARAVGHAAGGVRH